LSHLVKRARALRATGESFVLATLVRARGSSYRRPGARMLIAPGGEVTGCVSGRCLEGDAVRKAWWRTGGGRATLVTYDSSSEEGDDIRWQFGCDGVVDVLFERAGGGRDPLEPVARCLDARAPGALVTVFRSQRSEWPVGARIALAPDGSVEWGSVERDAPGGEVGDRLLAAAWWALGRRAVFVEESADVDALVEVIVPPPSLFVFGSGRDVLPVVAAGKALGWNVVVADRRSRLGARERFAAADRLVPLGDDLDERLSRESEACDRALAVVMSHDFDHDRAVLRALLRTRAAYIGVLGPRRRTERLLAGLTAPGGAELHRVRAPAGLAIGAETPEEIALSIVAEAQSVLTGSSAAPLRECGAIHPTDPLQPAPRRAVSR
jgi:xanthine dehydrogenase accessory factor